MYVPLGADLPGLYGRAAVLASGLTPTPDTNPPVQTIAGGGVNVEFRGKADAAARFTAPGEYVLHLLVNDFSGEGGAGEICCWTTALVKVTVTN